MKSAFPRVNNIQKIEKNIDYPFDVIRIYEDLDDIFLICSAKNLLYFY